MEDEVVMAKVEGKDIIVVPSHLAQILSFDDVLTELCLATADPMKPSKNIPLGNREYRMSVIDYIFTFRTYKLLRSQKPTEELLRELTAAMRALDSARHPTMRAHLKDEWGAQYISKWAALLELLDARFLTLENCSAGSLLNLGSVRSAVVDRMLEQKNFPAILEADLRKIFRAEVGFAKDAAVKILAILETGEVIEKRSFSGRTYYIPGCCFPFKKKTRGKA